MPADINAYALSLEFTLQSNAEEVLGGVSAQIGEIETKVQKIMNNIVKMSASTGEGISGAFNKAISNIQKSGDVATSSAEKAVTATIKQQKAVDSLNDARTTASSQQTGDTKNYKDILKEVLTLSTKVSDKELDSQDKLSVFGIKRNKSMEELLDLLRDKFKITKLLSDKKFQPPVKEYAHITKQSGIWNKALATTRVLAGHALVGFIKLGQVISKVIVTGLKMAVESVKVLAKGVLALGRVFAGAMKIIGLGPLFELLSITGMYAATIGQAAEEQERFRTVNFRALGSMEDLQDSVARTSPEIGVLRDELLEARVALREVGAGKAEIADLSDSVAVLRRSTDASATSWAMFGKAMTVTTGQTVKAEKEMWRFYKAAKEVGLTGRDLDEVLMSAANSAFILGSRGQLYGDMYNKILLQAAGAAKNLGVRTSEAVSAVEAVKDPLNAVAVLGREALAMTPEEIMAGLGRQAEIYMGRLKQMNLEQQHTFKREILARWSKLGISSFGEVEKKLRLFMETARMGNKAFDEGIIKPQDLIKKALEESSGLLRKTTLLINKIITRLMTAFRPIRQDIEGFIDTLLKGDIDKIFANWAEEAVKLAMVIKEKAAEMGRALWEKLLKWFEGTGIGEKFNEWKVAYDNFLEVVKEYDISQIVEDFASWAKVGYEVAKSVVEFVKQHPLISATIVAIGAAAVAFAGLASTVAPLIPLLTSIPFAALAPAALLFAKGAALVGAAIGGWALGRWIDQTFDLGGAFERVAEGTASWGDYLKTANPIGIAVVGYRKLLDKINEYNDKQQRHIMLAKKKQLAEQGLLAPLTAFDHRISSLRKRVAALGKDEMEKRRKLEAEIMIMVERRAVAEKLKVKDMDVAASKASKFAKVEAERLETEYRKTAELKKQQNLEKETQEQAKKATQDMARVKADAEKKVADAVRQTTDEHSRTKDAAKATSKAIKDQGPFLKISKTAAADYLEQLKSLKKGTLEEKLLREDIANKVGGMTQFLEKDLGEVLRYQPTETPEAAMVGPIAPKKKVVAEPLTTSRLRQPTPEPSPTDDLARHAEKQNESLESIRDKLGADGTIADLIKLLSQYLPQIAEKDTGLASSANQWYPG